MLYLFLGFLLPSAAFIFFVYTWSRGPARAIVSRDSARADLSRDGKRVVRHSTENENKRQRIGEDVASDNVEEVTMTSSNLETEDMTSSDCAKTTFSVEESPKLGNIHDLSDPPDLQSSPAIKILPKVESAVTQIVAQEKNQTSAVTSPATNDTGVVFVSPLKECNVNETELDSVSFKTPCLIKNEGEYETPCATENEEDFSTPRAVSDLPTEEEEEGG